MSSGAQPAGDAGVRGSRCARSLVGSAIETKIPQFSQVTPSSINSVAVTTDRAALVAVGDEGAIIMRATDGGGTWVPLTSGTVDRLDAWSPTRKAP